MGCYLGLTQRTFQSGQMMREGRISGMGDRMLRSLLIEASWIAIRIDGPAKRIYDRIHKGMKNRKKIAIVAVARHLIGWCWAMMRDEENWNPKLHC